MNRLLTVIISLLSTVVFAWHPGNTENAQRNKQETRTGLKAGECAPATAIAELRFNNVRARIENGGSMWQNRSNGTGAYEIPKDGGIRAIYSGSVWMGGLKQNGNLNIAALTFRNNGDDFFPGPLKGDSGVTNAEICTRFDRFWVASRAEALQHQAYYALPQEERVSAFPNYPAEGTKAIKEWADIANNTIPDYDRELAPYFDANNDGNYVPSEGDYPGYDIAGDIVCREATRRVPLFGDTTIYWINNDAGDRHSNTGSDPIRMEIRAQAFAFADQTAINNMTFYNYVMINQGTQTLNDTYFGQWVDADLGNSNDDFVGCDVQRGLGYCYNGDNDDDVTGGPAPGYGTLPPAVGIDFFQGPFQDNDGFDNYGPYDENLAPFGDSTVTYDEAIAGSGNLGPNGIPYKGLGIGYGDGVVDNERFGMRKFLYHNIGGGPIGDPVVGEDYYNYLRGIWRDQTPFIYGGNAHQSTIGSSYPVGPVSPTAFCDFMFPDDTDPVAFGSRGIDYPAQNGGEFWTESSAENPVGDRRFMQSAGSFTLTPGQVNNITVGVVWARATTGDNLSSVEELRKVDDIAQALFDNCFQIFEGPDAPDVNITELDRELILTLDNPVTSNNFQEGYSKVRPEIPGGVEDNTYEFEGYLVYQVKDESVSVSDLDNEDLARLVSQSDIKNFELDPITGEPNPDLPIRDLINYVDDPDVNLPVPTLMVSGSNNGVIKAIRVTNDLFATGADRRLVNNKPYYFIAIAYGYNEYQEYNPVTKEGQFEPFVPSRKSATGSAISSVSGIPHKIENQYGGTSLNAEFGDQMVVTRFEGRGNGGRYVRLTEESERAILESPNHATDELKYEQGFGPLDISVIDPLNLVPAEYTLQILDTNSTNALYTSPHWVLLVRNPETGYVDTVRSDQTIDVGGQQLIFAKSSASGATQNMGIAFNVKQVAYDLSVGAFPNVDGYTNPIGGQLSFANPEIDWLDGIADTDGKTTFNWIRSGNATGAPGEFPDALVNDLGDARGIDQLGRYENILDRKWGAGRLLASTPPEDRDTIGIYLMPKTALDNESAQNATFNDEAALHNTPSVDVVFTSDKSLWTRVPVIEMSEADPATQFRPKDAPSVDKNGRSVGEAGYNSAEGDLTSATGMSWFPGYALDPETGERLNLAFGEDTDFPNENGDDMLWNPTNADLAPGTNISNATRRDIIAGGKHYLYVFRNNLKILSNKRGPNASNNEANEMPLYDEGAFFMDNIASSIGFRRVWYSVAWATVPLVNETVMLSYENGYVPTEARVELRIEKEYDTYAGAGVVLDNPTTAQQSINNNFEVSWAPTYSFSTGGFEAQTGNSEIVTNNFESIRAVPNPYYGYAKDYEQDRLDNQIKITNLPTRAIIKIFTVNGTLIRTLQKDDQATTSVVWDLKNDANIPIASGTYIFHIEMPGLGEKVVKWFGVMRDQDLQNL